MDPREAPRFRCDLTLSLRLGDQTLAGGVARQLRVRAQAGLRRDIAFVEFHGTGRNIQDRGNFLDDLPLGQQLQNLPFAAGQSARIFGGVSRT